MTEWGRHAGYILASYAATTAIIGVIAVQTVMAYRRAKARLGAAGGDE
jgi:heme exporter protein CcmD